MNSYLVLNGSALSSARSIALLALALTIVVTPGCKKADRYADFLKRGTALSEKGDYNRALLEFQNAGQLKPSDPEPAYHLGLTYLRMHNIRAAVIHLRKAVELNPNHLE